MEVEIVDCRSPRLEFAKHIVIDESETSALSRISVIVGHKVIEAILKVPAASKYMTDVYYVILKVS